MIHYSENIPKTDFKWFLLFFSWMTGDLKVSKILDGFEKYHKL